MAFFRTPPMEWAMLTIALPALLLINLWTMLRFWQDKARARRGQRRIPEADLLRLALIGGSPGAWLARHLFRHKTRKQPFSNRLLLITLAQVWAIAAITAWLMLRPA